MGVMGVMGVNRLFLTGPMEILSTSSAVRLRKERGRRTGGRRTGGRRTSVQEGHEEVLIRA